MGRLTEQERDFVYRRACGEYAVNSVCKKIYKARMRSLAPDDQAYIRFLKLLHRKSYAWEEYVNLAAQVMAAHGDPYTGTKYQHLIETPEPIQEPEPEQEYPEPDEDFALRFLSCPNCDEDTIGATPCCLEHDCDWSDCGRDGECLFGWVFYTEQTIECSTCEAKVEIEVDDEEGAYAVQVGI